MIFYGFTGGMPMDKDEIEKLRMKIDNTITLENINGNYILEVSQKLDILILKFIKNMYINK